MNVSKLRVAFKIIYRTVLRLPKWSNTSEMYATHNIENFEALFLKVIMDLYNGLITTVI